MLARGVRFGSYEVLELLGTGGMGEVFRARDASLGREVAIKVLADRFRMDSQRLVRFEHEARVLASLSHPNIATLHAVERLGEAQALILELVAGETLADRIAHGPMPLPEVLRIARQIAAALEAAHEHGVVHRDLKPSNIRLRSDGTVKLLDFGLAMVCGAHFPGADAQAITVTVQVPEGGTLMGTPAYMSPEQARGLPVDKRTDIWAFGCVLYEMIIGEPPFKGERATDVVAKVIERDPDFGALPRETPPGVRLLLRRCLCKNPRERLRDIGDARLDLDEPGAADPVGGNTGRRPIQLLIRATAVVLALGGLATAILWFPHMRGQPVKEPAPLPVSRFAIPAPVANSPYGRSLAIAPDGSRIAYTTERGLVVRSRDRVETTAPDGEWIVYHDGQSLMKVSATGGTSVKITDSAPASIGSWGEAGIVYASMDGLFRVAPEGGVSQRFDAGLDPGEQAMFPQFLPGNEAVVFTVIPTHTNTPVGIANTPGVRVELLNLATGARSTLLPGGGRAQYLPTGHIVYLAGSVLYAVAFDLQRLELRGEPVSVLAGIHNTEFAVANDGTLAYVTSGGALDFSLVWVDRQGREEPLGAPELRYAYPRISPDGTRVALDVQGPPDRNIFIWDLRRKVIERFPVDIAGSPMVTWSRDGGSLAFGSDRVGASDIFLQAADGSGGAVRLLESNRTAMPVSFAPDGRLLVSADVAGRRRDVLALSTDGSRRVRTVLSTIANDTNPQVSPDGRRIAYDSDGTGQFEVYVRPYPDTSSRRWQVSTGGGRQPMWSQDGRELYYRDYDGGMWAVPMEQGRGFAPGTPVRLFGDQGYRGAAKTVTSARTYDVSRDGRFLMLKQQSRDSDASEPSILVVLNWFEELKRAVPAGGQHAAD